MFTFCIQKDTIRVEPRDFGKDAVVAIREEIHRRYANKVIPEVGLCISLLDILDASEGAVLYGDGCFYYRTEFRLIIFRPYIGEAFVGKVRTQSEHGITVSLGFFEDIVIPSAFLPDYSTFDVKRQEYFWVPPADPLPDVAPTPAELSRTPEDQRLYIQKRDWVRIRVEEEHWDDSSPINGRAPPSQGELPPGANGVPPPVPKGKPPYSLTVSMSEAGLGVVDWWAEGDEEEEQQEA